jgi:hypothetical protein
MQLQAEGYCMQVGASRDNPARRVRPCGEEPGGALHGTSVKPCAGRGRSGDDAPRNATPKIQPRSERYWGQERQYHQPVVVASFRPERRKRLPRRLMEKQAVSGARFWSGALTLKHKERSLPRQTEPVENSLLSECCECGCAEHGDR